MRADTDRLESIVDTTACRTTITVPRERCSPWQPSPTPKPAGNLKAMVGSRLGPYTLHELVGFGGMGAVFRARDSAVGPDVAVKVLHAHHTSNRDAVRRFLQEARLVQNIRHPNIVRLHGHAEHRGKVFIVMDLLSGTSLARRVCRGGVTLSWALAILSQVCDGLSATHDRGIVHRDLKPDNVHVEPLASGPDRVTLLDFGVAKLLDRDPMAPQTAAGHVIGTPAYMSPEQALGRPVDTRADIYSLGAILYRLVTGRPVFRARTFQEHAHCHLSRTPVPPSQTPQGGYVPQSLDAVIMRCLEKQPDHRIASATEVKERLQAIARTIATRA